MSAPTAPAGSHDAHAGEHAHPDVNYLAKFWWLVALTGIEVAIAVTDFVPGTPKLVLLTALSLWKAGIVLNYFMHVKMENLALKLALAFPLALVFILVILFLLDGVWLERGFAG